MSLKIGDYVLIYKNWGGVLFSELGELSELKERKDELNKSRIFTAWIVQVAELPNKDETLM